MSLTSTEEQILERIPLGSENNPKKPEFPPDNPRFPATPTFRVQVPGFSEVWLKDESVNPTGTHKDRMAWEIVVTYRNFLLAKKRNQLNGPLPSMSLISSGSAANAIQTALKKYGLPPLKVLVDARLNPQTVRFLEKIGCELFITDLAKEPLDSRQILALTHNETGFDITSADALDPNTRFYDWLAYETINHSPDYCFIPFGTGNLYENILNVAKKEISNGKSDPRFLGNAKKIGTCHFLGATTNNPKSKADKLYSPHLPFVHFDEQWIRLYRDSGFCGSQSNVYTVKEAFFDQALELAHGQGITCEASGIAGLALMLQMKETLPKDKKMLIVNTGKTKMNGDQ